MERDIRFMRVYCFCHLYKNLLVRSNSRYLKLKVLSIKRCSAPTGQYWHCKSETQSVARALVVLGAEISELSIAHQSPIYHSFLLVTNSSPRSINRLFTYDHNARSKEELTIQWVGLDLQRVYLSAQFLQLLLQNVCA